jgi:hypothetical protein
MTRYWRFETSIDRTTILAEADGVLRPRKLKLKEDASSKNAMRMWNRVLPWQSVVKSGCKYTPFPRNPYLSVLGHLKMRMRAPDNALGSMRKPGGCSFPWVLLYFCILSWWYSAFGPSFYDPWLFKQCIL